MIICFIVPETWHMTNVIIFHFGLFFVLLPPLQPPKNENFKKMKKMPEDIVLHKYTKNHDYMLYCSWDMAHDGCNCCFSFWAIFCLLTPLTAQKLKISKNEKNTWRYHHFTNVHQKLWLDDVQLLRYVAWWMDRQMDGGRDGWTDEWMDIWTEKVTYREVGGPPKNKFSKIMLICYRRF